jgi:DNA-directed RNA polymerase subunit E'/Rpb7
MIEENPFLKMNCLLHKEETLKMDPLFERRSMVKKVHVPSRYLQKNIQSSLLAQLKLAYEGKCLFEGYIQPESIGIVRYSLGRINTLKGGVDYDVEFQTDICMPHAGQTLRANVVLRSKVGIHAEVSPVKVLLPRDLHIGVEEFEQIEPGQDIEFEVVGAQFRQQDKDIIVVGKLKSALGAAPLAPLLSGPSSTFVAPSASLGTSAESEEKTVSVVSAPAGEKPKRKLKRKTDTLPNEPPAQRMDEGAP